MIAAEMLAELIRAQDAPEEERRALWLGAFENLRSKTALGPLRARVVDLSDEGATIEMPMSDAARQPFGLLHGGVSMLLAESAASIHACWLCDLRRAAPVGIEINGSHLRSAMSGRIQARATVLRGSRSTVVHRVVITDLERDIQLSEARVTNFYKEHHGRAGMPG